MAADIVPKPYSSDDKHQHVFLCVRYPMLRVVYQRKERPGDPPEKYIGFLKTAAGGIFQTNSDEIGKHIRALPQFEDGTIIEMSHEELGDALGRAPAEGDGVVQGAVGTVPSSRKAAPVSPAEQPPNEPSAARGPKRRAVAA